MMRRSLALALFLAVLSGAVFTSAAVTSPVILSLSPSSAVAGQGTFTLTVTGANFVSGSAVKFNSLTRTTQFVDSSHLKVTINGSDILNANTVQVQVVNPGAIQSSSVSFQIVPNTPQITSLNPNAAVAGGSGFTLQVTGQNFGNTSVVRVNNSARTTTFVNSTTLNAVITDADVAHVTTLNITVLNPNNKVTNIVTLPVSTNTAPSITLLDPNPIATGTQTLSVDVFGQNFVSGAVVKINGTTRTTTFVDSSHLQARLVSSDVNAPGSLTVTVMNPNGTTSPSATLTVANGSKPTITSLSPSTANSGSSGFLLTVIGTNFANNSTVQVKGNSRVTTFIDSAHLRITMLDQDIATPGQIPITVTTPGTNGGVSDPFLFYVVALNGPVLNSISPSTIAAGSASFKMLLTGSNFLVDDFVTVNGAAVATEYVSTTQLAATIPAATITSPATLQIAVSRKDGKTTSAPQIFTVSNASAPSISAINPSSVNVGSAAISLNVVGVNFTNSSIVTINGEQRDTQYVSNTLLTATLPASDFTFAHQLLVVVVNPGGVASASVTLNVVLPVPVITTLNPPSVISGDGGFTLSIVGTNFTSHSVINVNGEARATAFQSATGALNTTIAASEISGPGSLSITVTDNGATSDPVALVVKRPTIATVNPVALPFGSASATITVTGDSFLSTSVVVFKGGEKPTVYDPVTGSLTATLGPTDLMDLGLFAVTVRNSPDSSSLPFLIQVFSPGAPLVTSLAPSTIVAGSAATTLHVIGQNFVPLSVVSINGAQRTTTYVSSAELTVDLTATELANPSIMTIVVTNPDQSVSSGFSLSISSSTPPVRRRISGH